MPHAIQRKAPNATSVLAIDMNCMIYHVLREPKMLAHKFPAELGAVRVAWERKLQDEVCSYLTHIWRAAGSPLQVYIALDGVVPYAKIKQQRFRRFKSAAAGAGAWGLASPSPTNGAWGANPTWDTNAITPGTEFMAAMGDALRTAGSRFGWIISDTDEPGEGEHKVLRWLLTTPLKPGAITVYGLDADLILLCLLAGDKLGAEHPIFLMREAMAFGKLVRLDNSNEVELCFFKVNTLRESLQRGKPWSREQFYDYIFGMSFCGNDFLPTGLSLRIRDEGHAILLSCLDSLWKAGKHLVTFDEAGIARPSKDGLVAFAKWIQGQEDRLVLTTIKRKFSARLGESEEDNLPLVEQAEKPLVEGLDSESGPRLCRDWQVTYNRLALGDSSSEQRKARVSDFWRGWCWILDYYQGRTVDLEWVYPAGYPPTWRDLHDMCELPVQDDWLCREPLKPKEQLALVLPLSSWGLLLKSEFRMLPTSMPQYWPRGFALETLGKRFGWECEPMIPMLSPARLRHEVTRMNRAS
jgi:5'-3' exonuclease